MPLQFKIQIKYITKPPVWRRLLVPESITFEDFHEIIQIAFGWENYHMYQFSTTGYAANEIIGIVDEEDEDYEDEDDSPFGGPKKIDASKVLLSEVFDRVGQKFIYIYDFGDDWTHQITLEKITDGKIINAELLAGKGACPPEDCGGPWGYENLRDILSDGKHPEHKEMKKWLGLKPSQEWDADWFDLDSKKILVRAMLTGFK